jgi:superfamily II DNA or RNA helicase
MASEALDIKTLTTLIMCTPRSDIQQSIGRILREKHSEPIVVDIIDSHELFKNQWKKRRVFYKKENYKIIYTTSKKYSTDFSQWTTVYHPSSTCSSSSSSSTNKTCTLNKKEIAKVSKKGSQRSSSSNSCCNDSEEEIEEIETIDVRNKNNLLSGKCLIKLNKLNK